jgi:hypothetical protein
LSEQTIDEYTRVFARARVAQLADLAETISAVKTIQQIRTSLADDRREYATERAKIRTVPPRMDGTFDAQGELRESAIYNSATGPRRYRLIDPAVDAPRTVCYVEIPPGSGIDVAAYLGRVVGVRARGKYLKTDGVDPVPIVSAAEIVPLDRPGATMTAEAAGTAAKDSTQASAEEP